MDVLIVERDKLVRLVIADALEAEGIRATAVASDKEALTLPPDDAPAVVITGLPRAR
jgi:CheY-like chemotaxis protein